MAKKIKQNHKNMTAQDLTRLLAAKHGKDVFVPQCKTGASWNGGVRILDAWAMRKSWSNACTYGYEIKVSRSDFENDEKWTEYVPYVNEFSFICPPGLIKAHDLPSGIGLLWASMSGSRLITKVRAQHRKTDADSEIELMMYILMARAKIVDSVFSSKPAEEAPEDRLTMYREMAERDEARQKLAGFIQGHIRRVYDEMAERVRVAENQFREAERIQEKLKVIGLEWNPNGGWEQNMRIENEINALAKGVNDRTIGEMRNCAKQLTKTVDAILEIRSEGEEDE